VARIRTLADFSPALALEGRRINVDPETRRIAVRIARWDETHSGFGEKVRIPRRVNVDAAHVGVADLADGSNIRVATLPMDTMHAPRNLAALHAAGWYENSGKGVARVRYSVDDEGIRADGVLFDDVDDAQLDRVLAASASGDWRSAIAIKRFSDFENIPADFVGSCIVNVPGYSDTFSQSAGTKFALAASAHTILSIEEESPVKQSRTSFGTVVTAAGVSLDDVRDAYYREADSASMDAMPDHGYVVDVLVEPNVVITEEGELYYSQDWSADEAGTVTLGERVQVKKEWVPVGQTTVTAGGGEGEGCGEDCTGCGCGAKPATVTLSASAVEALLEGVVSDDVRAEAHAALVAGGIIEAVDPRDARIARLEQAMIHAAFNED
jgi:hypothetical protein